MREGFWHGKFGDIPKPVSNDHPFKGQDEFILALDKLEKEIWVIEAYANKFRHSGRKKEFLKCRERDARGENVHVAFKGSSKCLLCDGFYGHGEFDYKGWTWASCIRHYVVEHNVKPSDGFISFVLSEG